MIYVKVYYEDIYNDKRFVFSCYVKNKRQLRQMKRWFAPSEEDSKPYPRYEFKLQKSGEHTT